MFERFTDQARQVVIFAQEEARALRHNYIGTEHLLLGLLREGGTAASTLDAFDVTCEDVQARVARIIGQGDEVLTGQIPFTPRAKKVLELSLREALDSDDSHIGPEHILLGLVREGDGVAVRILRGYAELGEIRDSALGGKARAGESTARAATRRVPVTRTFIPVLLAGWVLFAIALGVGVLIGWMIWGR